VQEPKTKGSTRYDSPAEREWSIPGRRECASESNEKERERKEGRRGEEEKCDIKKR